MRNFFHLVPFSVVVLQLIAFAEAGRLSVVFNCTFEDDACNFEIVEPSGEISEDSLHWYRRQDIQLSDGRILYDHTYGTSNADGTVLFANGGEPGSKTVIELSSTITCAASLCCFNAYALMSKASTAPPGSLAFFIVQDSYGSNSVSTIIANMSFTSHQNYWTTVQQTFQANAKPFLIGIEAHNGGGGREFFVAVDDISVTSGMCESDQQNYGISAEDYCGQPPSVIGGTATVTKSDSPGVAVKATYTCMFGYQLVGPAESVCLLDGQWSTPPVCTRYREPTYVGALSSANDGLHGVNAEEKKTTSIPMTSSTLVTDCSWGEFFDQNITAVAPTLASLYLFTENPITCEGQIFRWAFLAAAVGESATALYLSVWRPLKRTTRPQFKLIGVNQITAGDVEEIVQFIVPGYQRIDVESGDIIGIIYKENAKLGAVAAYEIENLPRGGQDHLYHASVGDLHIEDLSLGDVIGDTQVPRKARILPVLQAFVGTAECSETFLPNFAFSGVHTVVPSITSKSACWDWCRVQPSCFAISFHEAEMFCQPYSYISEEVVFAFGITSMLRSCHDDCIIKLLANGANFNSTMNANDHDAADNPFKLQFDVLIDGPHLRLPQMPQSIGECELACRYKPTCAGFSYDNPFYIGSCILFTNITSVMTVTNKRSFRKMGCENILPFETCQPCIGWYQCKDGTTCMPYGRRDDARCLPSADTVCHVVPNNNVDVLGCPNPPQIQRGSVAQFDLNAEPPFATYQCNPGYEMLGSPRVVCLDYTWQVPFPICRPACNILPNVENGHVEEVLYGTVAKQAVIRCNPGYNMVGSSAAVCLNTSTWSALPSCTADCGLPTTVANAYWVITQGTKTAPVKVRYACNAGFKLTGSDTLRCVGLGSNNGAWTPQPPTCRPTLLCPSAPPLGNGAVVNTSQKADIPYAIYGCLSGFQLVGQSTVYCRENGKWDNLPFCAPSCGQLPTVPNSRAKVLSERDGHVMIAQYDCLPGYTAVGDVVVSCISSLWTRPPQCANVTKPDDGGSSYPIIIIPQPQPKPVVPKKPSCGRPPEIENGQWRAVQMRGSAIITAEYYCNDGFNLIGPDRLVCVQQSRGGAGWQPAIIPCCRRPNDFFPSFRLFPGLGFPRGLPTVIAGSGRLYPPGSNSPIMDGSGVIISSNTPNGPDTVMAGSGRVYPPGRNGGGYGPSGGLDGQGVLISSNNPTRPDNVMAGSGRIGSPSRNFPNSGYDPNSGLTGQGVLINSNNPMGPDTVLAGSGRPYRPNNYGPILDGQGVLINSNGPTGRDTVMAGSGRVVPSSGNSPNGGLVGQGVLINSNPGSSLLGYDPNDNPVDVTYPVFPGGSRGNPNNNNGRNSWAPNNPPSSDDDTDSEPDESGNNGSPTVIFVPGKPGKPSNSDNGQKGPVVIVPNRQTVPLISGIDKGSGQPNWPSPAVLVPNRPNNNGGNPSVVPNNRDNGMTPTVIYVPRPPPPPSPPNNGGDDSNPDDGTPNVVPIRRGMPPTVVYIPNNDNNRNSQSPSPIVYRPPPPSYPPQAVLIPNGQNNPNSDNDGNPYRRGMPPSVVYVPNPPPSRTDQDDSNPDNDDGTPIVVPNRRPNVIYVPNPPSYPTDNSWNRPAPAPVVYMPPVQNQPSPRPPNSPAPLSGASSKLLRSACCDGDDQYYGQGSYPFGNNFPFGGSFGMGMQPFMQPLMFGGF